MKRSLLALLGTVGAAVAIPVVMTGAFASSAPAPTTTASPGVAVLAGASAEDDPIVISSSPTTDQVGSPSGGSAGLPLSSKKGAAITSAGTNAPI